MDTIKYKFILWLLILIPLAGTGQDYSALIIANSDYNNYTDLESVKEDYYELEKTLVNLDYAVTLIFNANYQQTMEAIEVFFQKENTISLFYYSGHIYGDNFDDNFYIVPVDAGKKNQRDLISFRTIDNYASESFSIYVDVLAFDIVSNERPGFEIPDIVEHIPSLFEYSEKKIIVSTGFNPQKSNNVFLKNFVQELKDNSSSLTMYENFENLKSKSTLEHPLSLSYSSFNPSLDMSWQGYHFDRELFGPDDEGDDIDPFFEAKFPFPPPECNTQYPINRDTAFFNCANLGDVATIISRALEIQDYPYKYMSVPKGFAIVSQLEQYNEENGALLKDSEVRWTQFPEQSVFSWSMEYFSTLIFPKKSYLRIFVFIVTSKIYDSDEDEHVNIDQATDWLDMGVNRLPSQVKAIPFTENYSVDVLIYEFEVPETNHTAEQNCQTKFSAKQHYKRSGLKEQVEMSR